MIGVTVLGGWIAASSTRIFSQWELSVFSAATPAPKVPDANSVTPGVWGFVITFLMAVATVLLIMDMVRRIRRTRYRAEIAAKLDAEVAAAAEAAEGANATEKARATDRTQTRRGDPA